MPCGAPDRPVKNVILPGRGAEYISFAGRFGRLGISFVGHLVGIVLVFGGRDIRSKNGDGDKTEQE